MKKNLGKFIFPMIFLAAALISGCGKSSSSIDTAPPEIVSDSKSPADDSSDIPVNAEVSFSFNKSVEGVSRSSVLLMPINTSVAVNADVVYESSTKTVTLKPQSALAIDSYYVVVVTSDIHSLAGVPFQSESWLFTTGAATDTVKPTVKSVSPDKGASYVETNSKISVTFSESLQSSSVTADVFTGGSLSSTGSFRMKNLKTGNYLSGRITYDSAKNTALFEPGTFVYNIDENGKTVVQSFGLVNLSDWTNYQVELTSAIKDIAGNNLASGDYTLYSFMTDDENSPILSGVYPAEGATDIPRSTQVKLTFNETVVTSTVMTASNFYIEDETTHVKVVSTVYYDAENNIATLIPMSPSPLAANTTYRVYVSDGIKDLAANSLSSKNWTFTTGGLVADITEPTILDRTPGVNNSSVSPETSIVVKFSEDVTGGLTSISLTNKSTSAVIDSTVVYSAPTMTLTLTPKMALDQKTSYAVTLTDSIKDGSGNPLNSTSWDFTTADNTKPYVTDKIPGAQGNIAVNTSITVYFSEQLDSSTVSASNFTLECDGVKLSGDVSYNSATKSATFKPDAALSYAKTYTVTLLSGIKDLAGNTLNPVTWQFVTGTEPDTTAPTITSRSPLAGAASVSIDSPVIIVFDEPLSAGCINSNTVSLIDGLGTSVNVSVEYNSGSNSVTMRPSNSLTYGMTYTVNVKGNSDIKDLSGNQFAGETWTFTVEADNQAPTIIYRSPEMNTTGIAGNSVQIDVAFSEKVTGVSTSSFYIVNQADSYNPASISIMDVVNIANDDDTKNYRWRITIVNPYNNSNTSGNTIPDGESGWYYVKLTSAITDVSPANNPLATQPDWLIKIEGKDNIAPTCTHDPATGAVWRRNGGVYTLKAYFSEAVKNVDASSFKLEKSNGDSVVYDVAYDSGLLAAQLTIDADFAANNNNLYDTTFKVTMSSTITDVAGNPLAYDQWTINTDSDTEPPSVTSVYPANAQTLVPYNTGLIISAVFSEPVQNVTTSTFYLVKQGTSIPIAGTVSAVSSNSYRLTTSADLEGTVSYDVHLATGITDKAATPNAMTSEYVWSFKTTAVPDGVKPYISSVSSSGDTNSLPQKPTFTLVFSEAMLNDSSQVASGISLRKGSSSGSSVSVNFAYDSLSNTATITPVNDLDGSSDYYLVTSSSLKDAAGNQLDTTNGKNVYKVTTAADTTGPTCTIKYVSGSSLATFVSGNVLDVANPHFKITFSEAVSNVTSSTVTLKLGSTSMPYYVTYDDSTGIAELQLKDDANYVRNGKLYNTGTGNIYTITVTSSVIDAAGNGLTSNSESSKTFTVPATEPMINQIKIGGTIVAYNGTNSPVSGPIEITFNRAMNPDKMWLEIFVSGTDTQAGHSVPVTIGAHTWTSSSVLTVPLVGQLKGATTYALRFYGWSGTLEDTYGNLLARDKGLLASSTNGIYLFKTVTDSTAPTMSSPLSGKTVESNLPAVMVFFSEPMDTTVGTVTVGNGTPGTVVWHDGARSLVIPVSSLTSSAAHLVTLTGFKDLSGTALSGTTFTFSTNATSSGGSVTGFVGTEGFEDYSSNSFDTRLKNILLNDSVLTDSSYLDGSTTTSCDWLQVAGAAYSSDTSNVNNTTFGPKTGTYFVQAADWNWATGSYAEVETNSIDMSTAGVYLLSFEMAHIAEFNTYDRLEIYYKKSTDSSFSKITTISGSYDALYRYDSSIAITPTSRWKRHYICLPALNDGSVKIRLRGISAGERGASVYIDDLKIERY